jgi:hypothetical protein
MDRRPGMPVRADEGVRRRGVNLLCWARPEETYKEDGQGEHLPKKWAGDDGEFNPIGAQPLRQ